MERVDPAQQRQARSREDSFMTADPATPSASVGDRGAQRRAERLATPRLSREQRTMAAMLRIFCDGQHAQAAKNTAGLCEACEALALYARQRLAGCPYGPDKPTCANCKIHCYGPAQREQARVMMRHAGPKMLWRHPRLAIAHLIDGRRAAPEKPRNKAG
jgi:hypothetical protein